MRTGNKVLTSAMVRATRKTTSSNSRTTWDRFVFYSGVAMATAGGGLIVASKRPTRHGLGMLGAGSALALINSPWFTPFRLSALVVVGTTATVSSLFLKDVYERQIQRVFESGREMLAFPDNVRFDDGGPVLHAVTRPHVDVLVSPIQAIAGNERESIRVKIAGYVVMGDGGLQAVVGYAYASRSSILDEFKIDRVEMEARVR